MTVAGQTFPTGFRGYVVDDVRSFLRRVALELEHQSRRIAELEQQRTAEPQHVQGQLEQTAARLPEEEVGARRTAARLPEEAVEGRRIADITHGEPGQLAAALDDLLANLRAAADHLRWLMEETQAARQALERRPPPGHTASAPAEQPPSSDGRVAVIVEESGGVTG